MQYAKYLVILKPGSKTRGSRKCMPLCYVWVPAPAIYLCPLRINAMQVVGECLGAWGVGSPSPKGWSMVPALHLIVDNHGVPTLIGYCGEWPRVF